jgi:hypothetical protein
MTIDSDRDPARDLTIFTVRGQLTFDEQMEILVEFYGGDPTANVLWDFRGIEGNRISSDELRKIIVFIKQHEHKRPGGKTAMVAGTDLDFGLSRMSDAYAETEKLPWKIRPFRSMEEALDWIEKG